MKIKIFLIASLILTGCQSEDIVPQDKVSAVSETPQSSSPSSTNGVASDPAQSLGELKSATLYPTGSWSWIRQSNGLYNMDMGAAPQGEMRAGDYTPAPNPYAEKIGSMNFDASQFVNGSSVESCKIRIFQKGHLQGMGGLGALRIYEGNPMDGTGGFSPESYGGYWNMPVIHSGNASDMGWNGKMHEFNCETLIQNTIDKGNTLITIFIKHDTKTANGNILNQFYGAGHPTNGMDFPEYRPQLEVTWR